MSTKSKAELFLLSITLIWGSTFATSKYLLASVSPFLYLGIRFGLATILLAMIFPRRVAGISRDVGWKGAILGLLLFAGFATQTVGLQYTGASKSAFITGMMVVFTPICQLLIERRAPKVGNIVGIVLVTAGLYLLTSPEGSEFNIGDGLNLICAVVFALYIVYLDLFSKGRDPVQLTMSQFVICTSLGFVLAPLLEQPFFVPSPPVLGVLLYLTVFATVIAILIQVRYQKDTTPTRSAVIFSIEPVLASGFAYFILGEILGPPGMVGGGLIVIGVLVSELSPG
jgi:drug/metabolite transporter (DMT)-like permease